MGFEGYEYQSKILYEKQLEEAESVELRTIIDNAIANPDEEEKLNYDYYVIESMNKKETKVYDEEIIKRIDELVSINEHS